LLWAAQGIANEEIARRCHVDSDAVRGWRKRFADKGVDGVGKIVEGRGRKSWLPPGTVEAVIHDTLHEVPEDGSTQWTTFDGQAFQDRQGLGRPHLA
jgi:transposase